MQVIPPFPQVSRDTPLKTQTDECASEPLPLTDVVVPPEDESTVKGRDPSVFIWHVWADCTLKVDGGTDREWHLFFTREKEPFQSVQQAHLNINYVQSDKGWCDVTEICTDYIQNDILLLWLFYFLCMDDTESWAFVPFFYICLLKLQKIPSC